MNSLWEDIKKAVKDGYITAAGKTEEITRVGRIKLDVIAARRKLDKMYAALGEKAYGLIGKGEGPLSEDEDLKKAADEITALQGELQGLEKKIEEVKEAEREKMEQKKGHS